eukprot:3460758-Pleurochrysis_carterae.AAC.1
MGTSKTGPSVKRTAGLCAATALVAVLAATDVLSLFTKALSGAKAQSCPLSHCRRLSLCC